MDNFLTILNQPLSMGGMVLVAVLILNVKVKAIEKTLDAIQEECKNRKNWCLNYFTKNGRIKEGGE